MATPPQGPFAKKFTPDTTAIMLEVVTGELLAELYRALPDAEQRLASVEAHLLECFPDAPSGAAKTSHDFVVRFMAGMRSRHVRRA